MIIYKKIEQIETKHWNFFFPFFLMWALLYTTFSITNARETSLRASTQQMNVSYYSLA